MNLHASWITSRQPVLHVGRERARDLVGEGFYADVLRDHLDGLAGKVIELRELAHRLRDGGLGRHGGDRPPRCARVAMP